MGIGVRIGGGVDASIVDQVMNPMMIVVNVSCSRCPAFSVSCNLWVMRIAIDLSTVMRQPVMILHRTVMSGQE